jgi:hypothetical protein
MDPTIPPQPPSIQPITQIPATPVNPKSNVVSVYVVIILLLSLGAVGFLMYQNWQLKQQISQVQPTLTPLITPTTPPDPTADWKTYTNTVANFSLRYPMDVLLNQDSKGLTTSTLQVTVTKMSDIQDQPFNFTKETAIKDQQSLQQGKYGEHVDWPTGGSEKVITIGGKPAKTYTVFAVLEVCDVRFERTAIVYDQNYQIILRYTGPNTLKQSISTYLTTDAQNCSGGQVWNQNTHLYQDLEGKTAPESVQNWYDIFDQILSTFKFTK